MADADVICGIWNTDGEDECEGEEVVPSDAGGGSGGVFGVELV